MIQVSELHKYFGKGTSSTVHVLNNINLTFPEKGLVTIFGHSGSGKTTLLNILGLMDTFDSGHINWYGRVFDKYQSKVFDEIRNRDIGYIFQNYHLIEEESVYDNVAYPLRLLGIKDRSVIDKQVMYALTAVGMDKYKKRNVTMLSGGQQQRVAIARAIAKDSKVIIADEPTGNLDSDNTFEVMNIIKKISKERLVILVSHEEDLVRFYSDRIIQIKDGSIISDKENQGTSLQHKDSRNFYLKDLHFSTSSNQEDIQVNFYTGEEGGKLEIDVVQKGDTYYIKPRDDRKVIVVDENSEVQFVSQSEDEFRKELEQSEHDFDLSEIKIEESSITKRNVYASLGKAIKDSFFKNKRFFKRSKLTPVVFIIASVVLAFLFPLLNNALFVNKSDYLDTSAHTLKVVVNDNREDGRSIYDRLKNRFKEDDNILAITPAQADSFSLTGRSFYNYRDTFTFRYYPVNNANYPYDIYLGRKSTKDDEVVLSRLTCEAILNYKGSKAAGIEKEEDILHKAIKINNQSFSIVGISTEDSSALMLSPSIYQSIRNRLDPYVYAYDVIYIDAIDKEAVKKELKDAYRIVDPYVDGFFYQLELNFKGSAFLVVIISIMIIAIALYIILMVRSTMFKKIKEIGVLRTVGAKKSDIRNIFVGEMIALTTVFGASAYLGVLLFQIYFGIRYQFETIGLSLTLINPFIAIFGLLFLYIIAIVSALIPVSLLLRKTPIEIVKKYDI